MSETFIDVKINWFWDKLIFYILLFILLAVHFLLLEHLKSNICLSPT